MKVGELIEALSNLDPELQVFRPGYEGGFADVTISKPQSFCLDVHAEWYYGPHETSSYLDEEARQSYKQVNGIIL
jgi:hypothetical protein